MISYAQISPELSIQQASKNFSEMVGVFTRQVKGQLLTSLFWEFSGMEDVLIQVLEGEISDYRLRQVERVNPIGKPRYFDFLVIPQNQADTQAGLILIIEDSTQTSVLKQELVQERNELRLVKEKLARSNVELEHLNRFKSMLLSIAAHDMRTPLTVISGYVELLLMDIPKDDDHPMGLEMLKIVASQIDRLDRMLKDVLDLDQIERGEFSVTPIEFDLRNLIGEVLGMFWDIAGRKNIRLESALPREPIIVSADPMRVEQVLYNLLSNALKFTPLGGRILVSANLEEGQGVIKVQDNGAGIPASKLEHIFFPYYRTEDARDSKIDGVGLGLFIVKSMIDAQSGEVSVTSAPGKGSTFVVKLPAMDVSQQSPVDKLSGI